MDKIEIIEIGDQLGFLLPPRMIEAMALKAGSTLIAFIDSRGIILKSADDQPSLPADR